MIQPIPFKADRFRSAAAHYLAGRPAYPPALIRRVAELCRLGKADRVLDLGCGPGQLAIAFAPFAGTVLAIDPEPEMLAEAARAAAAGSARIDLLEGSSRDLGPELGRFKIVTIGRAFHWMDRIETLRRLDQLIEPDGAVILFRDEHCHVPDNEWLSAYKSVTERYVEESRRPVWKLPSWVRHEAILLDSPFSTLEAVSIIERRWTPTTVLIDRALSMSSTSRAQLGEKADLLCDEIRAVMDGIAVDGGVPEVIQSTALIARR